MSNELLYIGSVVAVAVLVLGGGIVLALTLYKLSVLVVAVETEVGATQGATLSSPPTSGSEPFWWLLFGAGGMVAALLAPVHIALTGIMASSVWLGDSFDYSRVLELVSHPISRIYLLVLISLPLFHWAHRFRFTLIELGMTGGRRAMAVFCYGSAVIFTILTLVILIQL